MKDNPASIFSMIIIAILFLFFAVLLYISIREIRRIIKARKTYRRCIDTYLPIYGKPNYETGKLSIFGKDYCFMMVFDRKRIVIINGQEYPYDSILNFSCCGQEHQHFHSSPISTLIRGEIGRATIGGDKGFFLGAMTTPQYVSHSYTYDIRILCPLAPGGVIRYRAFSEDNGEMAVMILEHILSVNELDREYGCTMKRDTYTSSN